LTKKEKTGPRKDRTRVPTSEVQITEGVCPE